MTFARNYRFSVYFSPYSLVAGEVGKPIFKPVLVSRHRSAKAARRALVRLILGTDPAARNYLRDIGPGVALRYFAEAANAPFRKYSANDLRGVM